MPKLARVLRRIFLWPARPGSPFAPWFLIAWRLLWFPVFALGVGLILLTLLCSHGPRSARNYWHGRRW